MCNDWQGLSYSINESANSIARDALGKEGVKSVQAAPFSGVDGCKKVAGFEA